jgi:hypothetical protein
MSRSTGVLAISSRLCCLDDCLQRTLRQTRCWPDRRTEQIAARQDPEEERAEELGDEATGHVRARAIIKPEVPGVS